MSEQPQSDQKPPLMSDVRRYLNSTNRHQLSIAETRYEYLLQRRDQLFDKVRNGLLALNSASLLAVPGLRWFALQVGQRGSWPLRA